MSYVITPAIIPCLQVRGSSNYYPVNRIFCVGRNYAKHVVEMGYDPEREAPFFFQKSSDSILVEGTDFVYPDKTIEVHHEVELVVALKTGGKNLSRAEATSNIYGYAVGLDMTRRDLQAELKSMGRPWEISKSFDGSAPCSAIIQSDDIGHPTKGEISLKKNGSLCQEGYLQQMIWKVPEIIAYLSEFCTLMPGDLIFTGTPSGVGPVQRGDNLKCTIDGVGTLDVGVV
ncbi:MAG: hypothetical protein CL398_10245 [Acidiferrobacteraceae bacterium]|nr:hypothetical protein [Acidiferrobacteraceae bacterium]